VTRRSLLASVAAVAGFTSCGYHVGGKADLVPKSIQTIAVPAFSSYSTRYKLADMLSGQIAREFNERTRFRVVDDTATADAVLNGSINAVTAAPNVVDPSTGRSTSVLISVVLSLRLVERTTGRVLYVRPSYAAQQRYSIAGDPHQYFDESGPAFMRLSTDVARDVVSSILENF
jgi:Lipopolysaccharide-assembly